MDIYCLLDKTGECPNYVSFFEKEVEASKELDRQVKYLMMEFGWDLVKDGYKVYLDDKVVFSLDKHILK
tara:strand:- start:53 stop:259 length:207 start_codon:yes stop_codon:yes gene_type:complete